MKILPCLFTAALFCISIITISQNTAENNIEIPSIFERLTSNLKDYKFDLHLLH